MRLSCVVALTLLGWTTAFGVYGLPDPRIQRRQDNVDTDLPSLTTNLPDASTRLPSESNASTSTPATLPQTASTNVEPTSSRTSLTKQQSSTSSPLPAASGATHGNSTTTEDGEGQSELPLTPRITPALGITGVFLICLGGVYALIGVKNGGVQIFLSSAFLASIATTALVDYVMHPPVSDAVQGGFFVAIFMTGAVFGGGALVFKELTEGVGCLLGGFCFSMWLLTLKPGGLITSAGGKGAFIGVFCVTFWALSWSQHTRPFALIGSTSLSGATAFTLGVDCFTRAGLKEFWFYIWDLNDDLFPLDTNTYPLTKGIRVEITVVVVGTIIGIMSQMMLWRVMRSQRRKTDILQIEDDHQREAVEVALGRQLERHNQREKSQWETQYGSRLQSQRNTILWQADKRYSNVSVVAVQSTPPFSSSESLEMNAFGPQRVPSGYALRNKTQSSVIVDVIQEVDEDIEPSALTERQKALEALEKGDSVDGRQRSGESKGPSTAFNVVKESELDPRDSAVETDKYLGPSKPKRRTQQSLSGLSKRLTPTYTVVSSGPQEHLVDVERPVSSTSSAAATLDEENEERDIAMLDTDGRVLPLSTPEIVISPAATNERGPGESWALSMVTALFEGDSSSLGSTEYWGSKLPSSELQPKMGAGNSPLEAADNDEAERKAEAVRSKTDTPPSQTSEGTSSSTDSLTNIALAQVPSQVTQVVLSFRTNEWAKHIASAEMPLYDEPETIEGIDEELPTHCTTVAPELGQKLPSVKPGDAGIGIASNPVAAQRSFSDPDQHRSSLPVPPRSTSSQSRRPPHKRSSRKSIKSDFTTSLAATPIDENAPTEFTAAKSANRRASGPSPYITPRRYSSAPLLPTSGARLHTAHGFASLVGQSSYELPSSNRPISQQSYMAGVSAATRLSSFDSRQPPQRDPRKEAQRRESLLAEWRLLQQQRASSCGLEGAAADRGRARMRLARQSQILWDQHQQEEQQRKQQAMDLLMRRPEMQDLHRDAMRKMQASANRNLRSSTG